MTTDEEREQLRTDNTILYEALLRQEEELKLSQQAKQDLREGLKQAIIAINSQQEQVKVLEGLIASQQERITTLERQQAKDSHTSSLPPSSDRFVRPPKSTAHTRAERRLVDNKAIKDILSNRLRPLMQYVFILCSAVSSATMICKPNQQMCRRNVR